MLSIFRKFNKFPSKQIYPSFAGIKFTSKISIILSLVLLLLLFSGLISVLYLNRIKAFHEYTTDTYLKCMNLSHQLESTTINEESLLSKCFLSNTPTYIFSLRQSHYEIKRLIEDLKLLAFDDTLKENINLLEQHEAELDKMLNELWEYGVPDRSRYELFLSHYTFIKNAAAEISSYTSNTYDSSRNKTLKLVNKSIVLISALSVVSASVFLICFWLTLRISKSLELTSLRDPLTGIFNRRALDNKLKKISSHRAQRKVRVCLIMLDIDHFKYINDTYGHPTGDKVLVEVANLLHSFVRSDDLLVRFGGEEIAILLMDADLGEAHSLAERLRQAVESHHFSTVDGRPIKITASLGVAQHGKDYDLLKEADEALYKSKTDGRNRVTKADSNRTGDCKVVYCKMEG